MWQANLLIIMCRGMRSGKHSSEAAVSFPLKPWNDPRRASTRASPLYLAFLWFFPRMEKTHRKPRGEMCELERWHRWQWGNISCMVFLDWRNILYTTATIQDTVCGRGHKTCSLACVCFWVCTKYPLIKSDKLLKWELITPYYPN